MLLFKRITSFFGPRRSFRTKNGRRSSSYHTGIDISAPTGTPVPTMEDGVVEKVVRNPKTGYGNYVVVRHPNGERTLYAHLNSIENINIGQEIKKGMRIGTVGQTGNSTGPHLHFTLFDQNGNKIDPLSKYSLKDFNDLATHQPTGMQSSAQQSSSQPYQKIVYTQAPNWWQRNMPVFLGGWSRERLNTYYNQQKLEREIFKDITARQLKGKGFTDDQIISMERLVKDKQSLTKRLGQNSVPITNDDLKDIGLNKKEISTINRLSSNSRNQTI